MRKINTAPKSLVNSCSRLQVSAFSPQHFRLFSSIPFQVFCRRQIRLWRTSLKSHLSSVASAKEDPSSFSILPILLLACLLSIPVTAQDLTAPATVTKSAYLGVATTPADEAIAKQVGLQSGVGLVVTFLDDKGPAISVLEKHDILQKVNDQLLVNPEQLAVLIRLQKPGDKVTLTLVRSGKSLTKEVTLGEKELAPLSRNNWQAPRFPFGPEMQETLRNFRQIFGDDTGWKMDESMPGLDFDINGQTLHFRPAQPRQTPNDPQQESRANGSSSSKIQSVKEHGFSLVLQTDNGKKVLTAKDAKGNIIFDGPVDTEEQVNALPESIRQQFDDLEELERAIQSPR